LVNRQTGLPLGWNRVLNADFFKDQSMLAAWAATLGHYIAICSPLQEQKRLAACLELNWKVID
jgi:hypothetical protein